MMKMHGRGGVEPGPQHEAESPGGADPNRQSEGSDVRRGQLEEEEARKEVSKKKKMKLTRQIPGRGGAKPGPQHEAESPEGADPNPKPTEVEIDRDKEEARKEVSEKKKMKKQIEEYDEGDEDKCEDRSVGGSGGHEPGGAHEVTRSQILGLETGEEGSGGCQSLGLFEGEEKDDDHRSKIDGAGGVSHGQEDEEARRSRF